MRKKIFILAFILAFGWSLNSSAHGVLSLDEIYKTLEVSEPTVLPDGNFYFFKNIGRGFRLLFTFNAAKKAELELKFADEKLAEVAKLISENPEKEALKHAFQNYIEAHNRLKARLESLKGRNKNVDKLLGKLADRVLEHQKLFEELGDELDEQDLEKAKKEIAEQVKKALELDEKKFKEKLKAKIEEDEDDDFEDLDFLGDLGEFDEDLLDDLDDLMEDLFGEDEEEAEKALEAMKNSQGKIHKFERRVMETNLADKDLAEAKRLLAEANKHWGFAKDEFEKENYKIVYVHLGHVDGFLKSLENILKSKPTVCIQLYDPVCGIDGKTYSNECFAKIAGVTVIQKGECPVTNKQVPPPPPSAEFKTETDDSGFYPSNTISVTKGSKVKLTFLVRTTNVYYGGLDFRSSKFKTESVKPGGSTTVEFTADESFTITSYWPASGVRKADLKVDVK